MSSIDLTWKVILFAGVWTLLSGCHGGPATAEPTVELTKLPPAGQGSPDQLYAIEGRASSTRPGQRIVLFARSGIWWVQPTTDHPFTEIRQDSTWKNTTHPGSAYAALLVTGDYRPPTTIAELPKKGGPVLAVATAEGPMLPKVAAKRLEFSGYQWEIRQTASDRGGTRNFYDPGNAWTDGNGHLHLRIAKQAEHWTSAEVQLTRSLGYGSYRFVVRNVSQLEPAAVFSVFTWDDSGPPREMDIEISRWGEPGSKNAQYVIQPYYVPANVVRFSTPPGVLTHVLRWESGRAAFKTFRGATSETGPDAVAEHVFTSGVPLAGRESLHINLYVFHNDKHPLRQGPEVIIEKFEYLP